MIVTMVYMKNDIDDSNGGGGGDGGELFHRHFLAIIIQLFFSFERGKQHFSLLSFIFLFILLFTFFDSAKQPIE